MNKILTASVDHGAVTCCVTFENPPTEADVAKLVVAVNDPQPAHVTNVHATVVPDITLRDYFAAHALTGILSCFSEYKDAVSAGEGMTGRVLLAYKVADLAMEARK